jgi:glycosyltransferase involved in cell wall biosynthesis
MKIGYITESFTGCKGNGITSQAQTWASMLNRLYPGTVTLVNPWEPLDWNEGDLIHLFGSSDTWFWKTAIYLKSKKCKVVWSPICDNIDNPLLQKFKTKIAIPKLQLFGTPYARNQTYRIVDKIFVRSSYEKEYIKKAYNVPNDKFFLVPLSISNELEYKSATKENVCLHISNLYNKRKNVANLIIAAKRFGFKLILAGNQGSAEQFKPLKNLIDGAENIQVLGYISENDKIELYKRSKVFALPSIMEGVGIVALDAAHFGCDIVITNIGGPKEYYNHMAFEVNPFSVDDIGTSVMKAMQESFQPQLKDYIDSNYSQRSIAELLMKCYASTTM